MNKLDKAQHTLYEYFIHADSIKNINSKINNNILKEILLDDNLNTEWTNEVYKDIKPTHNKNIGWIYEYIRDHHKCNKGKINKTLLPMIFYGNVEKQFESYPLKHSFNYEDVKNSPRMTVIYFISGGGQLVIKHPTFEKAEEFSFFDIKDNDFYVFNSELYYMRTPNPNKEPRISLTWICDYE